MDTNQPGGGLPAHRVGDGGADITALRDVAVVAEPAHELRSRLPRSGRRSTRARAARPRSRTRAATAGRDRTRPRRGLRAPSGRKRPDRLEQLDHRARPAVRHDQRQRVPMRRADVDEVDLDAVDLGRELRRGVHPCLASAPVVLRRPVPDELLDRRQLHALRTIRDEFLTRPTRLGDPALKVLQGLLRDVDLKRADVDGALNGGAHLNLL